MAERETTPTPNPNTRSKDKKGGPQVDRSAVGGRPDVPRLGLGGEEETALPPLLTIGWASAEDVIENAVLAVEVSMPLAAPCVGFRV